MDDFNSIFGIKVQFRIALGFIMLCFLLTIPKFFTPKFVGGMDVKPIAYRYSESNLVKLSDGNTIIKQDVARLVWKPKNKKEIFLLIVADSRGVGTLDLAYFFIVVVLAIILFNNVNEAAIFSPKSAIKLRVVGCFILIYPFLLGYLKSMLSNLAIEELTNHKYTAAYSMHTHLGLFVWVILSGYFTFILNKAKDLQREQDLTI